MADKIDVAVTRNAWVAGLFSWAIPGLGHFYLKRFAKGIVLGGIVWLLVFIGIFLGGHFYGLGDASSGFLSYVFGLFDLGVGLIYFISKVFGFASTEQAQIQTADYGNVFLMCAGLLNYLLALDVFDTVMGRKQ